MENGREGEARPGRGGMTVGGGGGGGGGSFYLSKQRVARRPTNGRTLGQESGHKKPTRDLLRRCLLHPNVACKKNPDPNSLLN